MTRILIALFMIGCTGFAGCSGDGGGMRPSHSDDASFDSSMTNREESGQFADESGGDLGARDGDVPDDAEVSGDVLQTPEEAAAQDAMLVAESRGWTLEQFAVFQAGVEAIGEVQQSIADERPEIFVGGAVGPEHDAAPRLYIKGPADDFVREQVVAAPVVIVIIDEQPFSADELAQRQALLSEKFLNLGFADFSVASDIQREGLMVVFITPAPGAPETADALLAALPAELRDGLEISFAE